MTQKYCTGSEHMHISKNRKWSSIGRFRIIKPLIENKSVLDIGCVGDYVEDIGKDYWLHKLIKTHSRSLLGIDKAKDSIEFLKGMGYNVLVEDAENFNLNQKFDVIVAGEILHYFSNFQGFFDSAKKHLRENGILILTIPNAFFFNEILLLIKRGYPANSPWSICLFDELSIKHLCERHNFSIEKVIYITDPPLKYWVLKCIQAFMPFKLKHRNIMIIAKL